MSGHSATCLPGISRSLVVCAFALLTGCGEIDATRPRSATYPPPSETGKQDCFYRRQVQDFKVLDGSNLILYAPNEANAYHVRLGIPSPELRFASTLAFVSSSPRICGYAGDALLLDSAGRTQRYGIIGVSRLDTAGLGRLLNQPTGDSGPPPAPVPTPAGPPEIERDVGGEPP